jgi:two-component system heavy metal sensor histidine kinase CusS
VIGSLRRTLALRFAATMAVGLLLVTGSFYWAATRALHDAISTAALERDLVLALAAIVIAGTAATLMGAWHFTSSAVRPVAEITAQATRIEAGTLNQRIRAHAETEEYEGLVAVLNRMLERLERGFAAQRRLTSDVSHELRTPLTALRGEIEVALRSPRSPREYQLVLRSALEEIERLSTMSEDLLLITRADARVLALHRTPTNVPDLVDQSLDHLLARIAEKDITVGRAMDGGEGVSVDPALVLRVVEHLLDNAVTHTPPGGRIDVRVEDSARDGVRVTVANSGSPIAVEDLPHLFEPFYRADTSRTRTDESGRGGGGPGLGLAMVAAIAQLHDGTARVSADPRGGARFEVELGGLASGPFHDSFIDADRL